jgi:hypothetical protein
MADSPAFAGIPRTDATTVTGARGPEDENSVRLVDDVEDKIYWWLPQATPLITLSSRLKGSRTAHQYKFDVLSLDVFPRSVKLNEAALVDDTDLVFQSGQGARVPTYAVLLNTRTGESVYVTAMSTDTATVERGIGSSQVDMAAGDTLIFTRAVFEDGSGKGDFKTVQVDNDYNYTEILKTGYGFTGRQQNTEFYGGSDVNSTRKWAGIEHLLSREHQFFFGTRHLRTNASGHLTTFSGGLDYFVTSNIWNLDGTVPSKKLFNEAMEVGLREGKGGYLQAGSAKKFLFASTRWISEINNWAEPFIRIEQSEKTLGLRLMSLTLPFGTVMLVHTPVLDRFFPDRAYLVDLNHFDKVTHRGRGNRIVRNIQNNDVDGMEEQYVSDEGAQITLEQSHMIFKGLDV